MIDSKVLSKVIEYSKYHEAEAESCPRQEERVGQELREGRRRDALQPDPRGQLPRHQAAARLTCKTVADEIKGKPLEDIRARFNIKPEFVPEELPTAKLIEWIEEFGTTPTCEISARIESVSEKEFQVALEAASDPLAWSRRCRGR